VPLHSTSNADQGEVKSAVSILEEVFYSGIRFCSDRSDEILGFLSLINAHPCNISSWNRYELPVFDQNSLLVPIIACFSEWIHFEGDRSKK
jgi:hypothetical protein